MAAGPRSGHGQASKSGRRMPDSGPGRQLTRFDLREIERRMRGALGVLKQEFGGLRTGRANAGILDPITVTAYGNPMPLNQLATINVPESRLITVQVWDRSQVGAVERAIRES